MCSLCIAPLRGPLIGGQDRDGASYRCSAQYTLSRFAGLPPGGKHVTGFSGRFALLQIQFLCHPLFEGALWVLSHGAMSLQESIERFILPPLAGEVRRSRIVGGERSEPISRLLIMPYDTER